MPCDSAAAIHKNPRNSVEPDDGELVRRCRAGDKSAFSDLVTKYRNKVYNMVYRMVGNEQDALDLARKAFSTLGARFTGLRVGARSTLGYTGSRRMSPSIRYGKSGLTGRWNSMTGFLLPRWNLAREPHLRSHCLREKESNKKKSYSESTRQSPNFRLTTAQ